MIHKATASGFKASIDWHAETCVRSTDPRGWYVFVESIIIEGHVIEADGFDADTLTYLTDLVENDPDFDERLIDLAVRDAAQDEADDARRKNDRSLKGTQ